MANCVAVSADTSSAAAGITPVVGTAALAFWALIVKPILCKLAAVAANISGCVVTNDTRTSLKACASRVPVNSAAVVTAGGHYSPRLAGISGYQHTSRSSRGHGRRLSSAETIGP